MKRKLLAMVCAVSMIASLGAATVYASDDVKATGDEKIALITMDSIDQHWITLNEGAQEEAKELGVTVDFMSPNTKDDAQQKMCIRDSVITVPISATVKAREQMESTTVWPAVR